MFTWLRRLLARGPLRSRDIFHYHDGVAKRQLDPMLAWERIRTDPECDLQVVLPASARGEPDAMAAHEAFIRRVFEVPPYDPATGRGLTILEQHDLFNEFMLYMEGLKKKRGLQPISWPPTDSGSSAIPPGWTTRPESDLCSNAPGSTDAAAT
jgi:hypothetical protein